MARFVFNVRHLSKDGRPKAGAFSPEYYNGRFETSVCGLEGVGDERLWHLGATIRAQAKLSAVAALQVSTKSISFVGLVCEPAPIVDFPEHGVIIGWADGDDEKHKRIAKQQALADAITTTDVRRPPTYVSPLN